MTVLLFVIGLCIGSFCNVLIHRIPKGESILGRSKCPHCKREIPIWLNIPILSYLFLKGRCRWCGERISSVYPIVELLGGIILLFSYKASLEALDFARISLLLYLLLVLSFIDIKHLILPDVLTLPGTAAGFIFSLLLPSPGFREAVLAAAAGSLGFLAIREIYARIRGIEGLGMGDVKLMAMIGAFTGMQGVIGTVLFGSSSGILYSLILMVKERKLSAKLLIPFGPFLSIGCAVFLVVQRWSLI